MLRLLLFLINDSSDNVQCNPKLFAEDTSLFSHVQKMEKYLNNLNKDLEGMKKNYNHWKMNLNPDPAKKAQEVILSRKIPKTSHPEFF